MSKLTLIEADLVVIIKNYDNQIFKKVKSPCDNYDDIKKEIVENIYNIYQLTNLDNESENLLNSKQYFVKKYVNNYVKTKIELFKSRINKIENEIPKKLIELKSLTLPEQRSVEWFKIRENILTASSLADALGKGHFNTRESLLIDKTSTEQKVFATNDIIQWGVKYEPIATMFYELLNNLSIVELGLVPHPELKIFGASPDGICDIDSPKDYVGRMLEIKCPPIRKFWVKTDVPLHYWMQMQGQLETCDLEECDFLQVKLFEYDTYEDYVNDKVITYDGEVKHGYCQTNEGVHPKGCLVEFKKDGEYHYEYPKLCKSTDEYLEWSNTIIDKKKNDYDSVKISWWKIDRYSCDLVGRDNEWWDSIEPKIIDFWEDVEHYRRVGNEELILKKEKRKRKKKPVDNSITVNIPPTYLLDTSSDEN